MASVQDLERAYYGAYLGYSETVIAAKTIEQLRLDFLANAPLTQTAMDARYVRAVPTGKVYDQTAYATASRPMPNGTTVGVALTTATNVTPYGYATQAQANAIKDGVNSLNTDVIELKKVVNAIIDDLQTYGMFG